MNYDLWSIADDALTEQILSCNAESGAYGLQLTRAQAAALCETRQQALQKSGRLEFQSGLLEKLIHTFCDSPYLTQETYEPLLQELVSLFYAYKTETWEKIPDEALLKIMKENFDGPCGGAPELLNTVLQELVRWLRAGKDWETFQYTGEGEG